MKTDFHKNYIKVKSRKETKYIVIHCSATLCDASIDWKTIDRMHREKGWLMCGYHYVIKADGTIQNGRDEEAIGAHVAGHNHDSIGICLVGGVDKDNDPVDNFTAAQKESLARLLLVLKNKYPDAVILGHRDFKEVKKDCPCFDVKSWLEDNCKLIPYVQGDLPKVFAKYDLSLDTFVEFNPQFNTIDNNKDSIPFIRVK